MKSLLAVVSSLWLVTLSACPDGPSRSDTVSPADAAQEATPRDSAITDATPTDPDATPTEPDATPTKPDTTTTDPDATTTEPDATDPDATTTEPDTTTTEPDATTTEPDATPTDPDATDAGEPTGEACTAQVEIAFYSDANCTQLVMSSEPTRIYDTTQSCFSWEGNSAAGLNSATRFRCFKDRLCYSQHPGTLSCDSPLPTDKEARTDVCVVDTENPDGKIIYAKIVGGTESCPEPPAGFECPLSDPKQGTTGISECSMAP